MGGKIKTGICETCGNSNSDYRAKFCKSCWVNRSVDGKNLTYRRHQMKKKYSLTLEKYDEILKLQNNSCAICKTHSSEFKDSLYVDHDRSCCPSKITCGNCIRGLLCKKCNFALGLLNDNEAIMQEALNYIIGYNRSMLEVI